MWCRYGDQVLDLFRLRILPMLFFRQRQGSRLCGSRLFGFVVCVLPSCRLRSGSSGFRCVCHLCFVLLSLVVDRSRRILRRRPSRGCFVGMVSFLRSLEVRGVRGLTYLASFDIVSVGCVRLSCFVAFVR